MARFMSPEWAEQVKDTVNAWPGDEYKATKLQDFWDWIEMVKPGVTGTLVLAVRDMPGDDADALVLKFDAGTITSATVGRRADVEASADYVLAGSHADWAAMIDGYDVGKTVMYRKLVLEKGQTLLFFMAVFFWTEMLLAIQSIDTEVLQPA